MRKALLIIGIIVLALGVSALLLALFFKWAYSSVLDGSQALYDRLHQRMIISLVAGIILAVIGVVCLIARRFGG
ncbi:MAG: hypothetical protein J5623_03600 [Clostridiales bacterium]|nr:hypothetical protein [Clostridiales bacterium]